MLDRTKTILEIASATLKIVLMLLLIYAAIRGIG
jgi:hypothetical protein